MNAPALNPWVYTLQAPAIPTVLEWADAYDGACGPLLGFSQAVPGYPPPGPLLKALGEAAADRRWCGYGDIAGELPLRETYANWVNQVYDARVSAANVQITAGCNQAFGVVMQTLCQAGDRVLLVEPYYFNHYGALASMGAQVQTISALPADGFLPRIEQIQQALSAAPVRALVLISPNNPCGTVYPPALIEAIAQCCRRHGTWLVLDETYRDFIAIDGEAAAAPHRLLSLEDWPAHVLLLYSFSKSFCIPGHRLGAIVAGQPLMHEFAKVMDNQIICAPRAPQIAVAQTLDALNDWREANRAEISRRAAALHQALAALPDWRVDACGAYFAYIGHPFADKNSVQVAQWLATARGVLTVPGEFFGANQRQHLRLAFANASVPSIAQLSQRLK